MNTLFFDCSMGAAGDMLIASLLELIPEQVRMIAKLNALGLPDVSFTIRQVRRCGILGTEVTVRVHGEEEDAVGEHHGHEHHRHTGLEEIRRLVESMPVSDAVKKNVLQVYQKVAAAESAVHGVPVTEIHFHEIGAMDAVMDITAFCLLLEELAPERIVVSPICVGSGQIHCAHGLLPIPAPATAELLKGVPIYAGSIKGELCTPTGAALLTQFASEYAPMPALCVEKIGYGMGKRDYPAANCVRAFWGRSAG